MSSETPVSFKIDIQELKKIANLLIDNLEQAETDFVEVPVDYYWHIPKEQMYNPFVDPKSSEFTMGQLTDDWRELRKFLSFRDYEPISYGLVWLSAILRAIGEYTEE